jgi:hypothetical protein
MKTYKQTGLLIERLKTSEIDNFLEVSENYPNIFNGIYESLSNNRYYTDVTFNVAVDICTYFTLNGKYLSLSEFYKYFKS